MLKLWPLFFYIKYNFNYFYANLFYCSSYKAYNYFVTWLKIVCFFVVIVFTFEGKILQQKNVIKKIILLFLEQKNLKTKVCLMKVWQILN